MVVVFVDLFGVAWFVGFGDLFCCGLLFVVVLFVCCVVCFVTFGCSLFICVLLLFCFDSLFIFDWLRKSGNSGMIIIFVFMVLLNWLVFCCVDGFKCLRIGLCYFDC